MSNLNENDVAGNGVMDNEKSVDVNFASHLKFVLMVSGLAFIVYGGYLYSQDLDYYSNPMHFYEETYVGGDAYNYIISAARSTAVMVKSLIWFVLGCASIIISRTINNAK